MEVITPWFVVILELPPENIYMLLFLSGLTVLGYYFLRRFRKERMTKLGNFETLKEVHGHSTAASPLVLGVKLLIVTLLFLTATDSIEVRTTQTVANTDIVLAIDSSQSMMTPDYRPTRLDYVKANTVDWMKRVRGTTNFSVISFGGNAEVLKSAEKDRKQIIRSVRGIEGNLEDPGTALAPAISLGVEMLEDSGRKKRIIVITDGQNTADKTLEKAVEEAVGQNVKIYFIGIEKNRETENLYSKLNYSSDIRGVEQDIKIPTADADRLQAAAARTGGEYYEVDSPQSFDAAFSDVIFREAKLGLNSDYIILVFISILVITELSVYSRYGAI